jgi:4-alpha-glucanotransferase
VSDNARRPHTDPWSIDDGYFDAMGEWRATSPSTHQVLVAAMRADPEVPPPPSPVTVLRIGRTAESPARGDLALEDGRVISLDGALPPDLPLGYHELRADGGSSARDRRPRPVAPSGRIQDLGVGGPALCGALT